MGRARKGFSLVETVIAMALIGVLAVAGFESLRLMAVLRMRAAINLMMMNHARQTMEGVYFKPDIQTGTTSIPISFPISARINAQETQTVTESGDGQYKVVEIRTAWSY